jgi:hypothetical protein
VRERRQQRPIILVQPQPRVAQLTLPYGDLTAYGKDLDIGVSIANPAAGRNAATALATRLEGRSQYHGGPSCRSGHRMG